MRRFRRAAGWAVELGGLAAVLAGAYALVVLVFGRVPNGAERRLLLLSLAAAAVTALVFGPARERLSSVRRRLLYGARPSPEEVVERLRSRFSRAVPLDELLLEVVESLRESLGLVAAEVWTASGSTLELTASDPERPRRALTLKPEEERVVARATPSGEAWAEVWLSELLRGRGDAALRLAPVTHAGELHGLVVAERLRSSAPFGAEEERLLAEVARLLGLALHNLELDSALQATLGELRRQADELRLSRARVVAAGDAERRRIERDLHDGAQQRLVSLAVKVGLARELVRTDSAAAQQVIDELAAEVESALDELRDLAHGIYPPLLADAGLCEAIPVAAARAALPVRTELVTNGRYPADVESAVYFCCLEALQNAAKHAGDAATAVVRVVEDDGRLRFEVNDDGRGFDTGADARGSGLASMADRLGALGGDLTVESSPGDGTTVRGGVPVSRPSAR